MMVPALISMAQVIVHLKFFLLPLLRLPRSYPVFYPLCLMFPHDVDVQLSQQRFGDCPIWFSVSCKLLL